MYREFREGESHFSKAHIPKTREARLRVLRGIERSLPEETIPPHEQARFEIDHCGTPVSLFPKLKSEYAVLEVDERYSPKVKLCSLSTGHTGVMKLKKALFQAKPIAEGAILRLISWDRRPAYQFIDGKARPRSDMCDLWITDYELIP